MYLRNNKNSSAARTGPKACEVGNRKPFGRGVFEAASFFLLNRGQAGYASFYFVVSYFIFENWEGNCYLRARQALFLKGKSLIESISLAGKLRGFSERVVVVQGFGGSGGGEFLFGSPQVKVELVRGTRIGTR